MTQQARPNIILINCDDLGYGDLGCYGNTDIATPNIDALADRSIRCTNFHAAAAWCMPSRKGLMTGHHPYRGGLHDSPLISDKRIMPEMFKELGYRTALIGKWHLGMQEDSHPNNKGFDYFYGTKGSNDWDGPEITYKQLSESSEADWKTPHYRNDQDLGVIPQSAFTERYTKECISYINDQHDKPFFIYLAHNMPHVPLFPSPAFKGRSTGGVYGDVVEEIDWSVGEILKTIQDAGIENNTIVIFTSDNGPWTMFQEFGGTAKPLRGEKTTCWEGGPRVPAIISWPGQFPAAQSDDLIINLDLYATFADLLGFELQNNTARDSISILNVFKNGERSNRHEYLFCHDVPMSYISGDYKIHYATLNRTRDPDTMEKEEVHILEKPILFNITKDISESEELSDKNPSEYKRMQNAFELAVSDIWAGQTS